MLQIRTSDCARGRLSPFYPPSALPLGLARRPICMSTTVRHCTSASRRDGRVDMPLRMTKYPARRCTNMRHAKDSHRVHRMKLSERMTRVLSELKEHTSKSVTSTSAQHGNIDHHRLPEQHPALECAVLDCVSSFEHGRGWHLFGG